MGDDPALADKDTGAAVPSSSLTSCQNGSTASVAAMHALQPPLCTWVNEKELTKALTSQSSLSTSHARSVEAPGGPVLAVTALSDWVASRLN